MKSEQVAFDYYQTLLRRHCQVVSCRHDLEVTPRYHPTDPVIAVCGRCEASFVVVRRRLNWSLDLSAWTEVA